MRDGRCRRMLNTHRVNVTLFARTCPLSLCMFVCNHVAFARPNIHDASTPTPRSASCSKEPPLGHSSPTKNKTNYERESPSVTPRTMIDLTQPNPNHWLE